MFNCPEQMNTLRETQVENWPTTQPQGAGNITLARFKKVVQSTQGAYRFFHNTYNFFDYISSKTELKKCVACLITQSSIEAKRLTKKPNIEKDLVDIIVKPYQTRAFPLASIPVE